MKQAEEIGDGLLTPGEFAGFMRHFKATLPADSPLADLGAAPVDRASLSALRDRGLLEPAWGEAAGLVAGARPAALIRQAYVDGIVETGFYPQNGAGHGGALATPEAGGCRLLFPVRTQDAMSRVIDPLDPIGAAPAAFFDHTFSAAALAALAAAIDQLRALFAASLLERRALDIIALRVSDMMDQLNLGATLADNRSLVRLFGAMLPEILAVPTADLEIGLFELTALGLLQDIDARPDLLMPKPEVVALAYNLMSPLPAVSLQTSAPGATAPLVLVRGTSLWRLVMLEDGRFRLQGIDGLTAIAEVMELLAAAAGPNSQAAAPVQAPSCPACGAPAREGARFCARCGAALPA